MPIPAGAGVISSVIHFQRGSPIDNPWIALVWLCLLMFTSFLMVSNWRFWSAKELTTGGRHPFQLVTWIVIIGTLIALYHQYMLIIIAMAYLVSGVVARLAYSWSRERRHSTVPS
jgi:CDP-diacylglycerol--serine O-phosphatidyltransferase